MLRIPNSVLLPALRRAITATNPAEVAGLTSSADPGVVRAKHEEELGKTANVSYDAVICC